MNTGKTIVQKKCTIVDVRTPGEFNAGHVEGAINIPLQQLPQRVNELKNREHPLLVCCLSGARSAQACRYLLAQGIECTDGGGWQNIQQEQKQEIL